MRTWLTSCHFVLVLCLCLCLALPLAAQATVLHVPADYPDIQSAINGAVNGDTVLVAPGLYTGPGNRNIYMQGKAVRVVGE